MHCGARGAGGVQAIYVAPHLSLLSFKVEQINVTVQVKWKIEAQNENLMPTMPTKNNHGERRLNHSKQEQVQSALRHRDVSKYFIFSRHSRNKKLTIRLRKHYPFVTVLRVPLLLLSFRSGV